jgi:hypothetical protein
MKGRKGKPPISKKHRTIWFPDGTETPNPFARFLHLHQEALEASMLATEEEVARQWRENQKGTTQYYREPIVMVLPYSGKHITIP